MIASVQFRQEREASWTELETLLGVAETRGVRALDPGELARLPVLYRAAVSSLSVARAISLDKNVVGYLESLCGRAYLVVYATRRHLGAALAEFFTARFPASLRALRRHLLLAAAVLALGAAVAYVEVARDPGRFDAFVDPAYAGGRGPTATTAELRDALYSDGGSGGYLGSFAAFLFTNNARIGILAFALGFAAGIPTLVLLFTNGLIIGAFAGLYAGRGLGLELWAWMLPHGVTELSAVVVCGAAGLALAEGLLVPGQHDRLTNLAAKGRVAGGLVIGAVGMFFVAGLIEGIFRQTVTSVPIRLAVAATTAALWAVYIWRAGRRRP